MLSRVGLFLNCPLTNHSPNLLSCITIMLNNGIKCHTLTWIEGPKKCGNGNFVSTHWWLQRQWQISQPAPNRSRHQAIPFPISTFPCYVALSSIVSSMWEASVIWLTLRSNTISSCTLPLIWMPTNMYLRKFERILIKYISFKLKYFKCRLLLTCNIHSFSSNFSKLTRVILKTSNLMIGYYFSRLCKEKEQL